MKVFVVIESMEEHSAMKVSLAKAGIKDYMICSVHMNRPNVKTPIKELRKRKLAALDQEIKKYQPDYIVASGETAARQVLDTSTLNISKIRGRDFDYQFGTKQKKEGKK